MSVKNTFFTAIKRMLSRIPETRKNTSAKYLLQNEMKLGEKIWFLFYNHVLSQEEARERPQKSYKKVE